MQLPNQRGSFRQQQGPPSLAIRTKKYQLDTNTYTRMAMTQVWRKEWWYALIPFAIGVLPAAIWPSWWWLASGLVLTILYVLLRSSLVTGVTQMEQTKPLFERVNYEIDNRQLLVKLSDKQGMNLGWDMIGRAKISPDGYLLWLKQGEAPADVAGWRRWVARTFDAPIFILMPPRIFNSPTDIKLFEAILRRKNLLPAEPAAAA